MRTFALYVSLFLVGSTFTFTYLLMVFVSMGWLKLSGAETIEHPDYWYHVERICHKTRVGGFGWQEECIDVKRRPR